LDFVNLLGPPAGRHRTGMVTFSMGQIHAHDVVTLANHEGLALRGGHHCNQPLMRKLGTPATSRASFYLYNTPEEIDRLVEVLQGIYKFFNR
jgi:cysteine desulfurase/selenocysteine lyase